MLSGGERNRLNLAMTLSEGGNVLLLDEPTNDLDVETLRSLEDALEEFPGCAVVISHDRWFLDRIATHILAWEGTDEDPAKWFWFEGNYADYEANKLERLGSDAARPHRVTLPQARPRLGSRHAARRRSGAERDQAGGPTGLATTAPVPTPTSTQSPVVVDTTQAVTSLSKILLHLYHVGLVLVIALVVRYIAIRTIRRFANSIATGRLNRGLSRLDTLAVGETAERREQRAATLGSVLKSIANGVIFTLALILILGELGLNLAPILASAGIVGVALGFGAQSVVKDFLAGIFLVLEDQYGVGDVIDLQKDMGVTGTVEAIGLRSTRLRDVRGNLWHIRNGNVNQVGNVSQGWSRILLDVLFDLDVDVPAARAAMLSSATAFAADPDHADDVLEEPAVWGVEDVNPAGVTIRLAIKTRSAVKDDVARAVRERLLAAFDEGELALAGATPIKIAST